MTVVEGTVIEDITIGDVSLSDVSDIGVVSLSVFGSVVSSFTAEAVVVSRVASVYNSHATSHSLMIQLCVDVC